MTDLHTSRRRFLLAAGTAGAGLMLATASPRPAHADEKEVGAVEDLMREHGVLRRALLVYAETAAKLHAGRADVDAGALNDAAKLFRTFGEDYHERQLEEAHIFPVVTKAGGPAAAYPDILTAQHNRGREITDYILAVTARGKIAATQRVPLARVFDAFVVMYENHAAREDTIVFPAWKDALSEKQIDELGDQFEEIEHRMFGKDGFEDAVKRIAAVERRLGYADLSQFTAPPPHV